MMATEAGGACIGFKLLVDEKFLNCIDKFLCIYIGYLLLFNNGGECFPSHLEIVLKILKEQELYVSPKEYDGFQDEMNFFNLLNSKNRVKISLSRFKIVMTFPIRSEQRSSQFP